MGANICRHCGEPIAFVDQDWIHEDWGTVFCQTTAAQPLEEDA